MYRNEFYHRYAKNIHSQNGEDGIIEELLKRLNIVNGWVCEFGAWDGIYLSNTFNLTKKNFRSVFIEGDKDKFQDLLTTVNKYPNIIPINKYVGYENIDSLDSILSNTEIPIDFDILSIDIDSYDYQIWKSVEKYKPKLVIIEINSSVSVENNFHIHSPGKYQSTGFHPMLQLGIEKGYKFVLHTGNMFFVRIDLFDDLNIPYNPLDNFRPNWGGAR